MCFSSPSTPPPTPPAPAKAPARLDISNLEQTPSHLRKQKSKGKRGVRNLAGGDSALNVAGKGTSALTIQSKRGGKE